MTQVLPDRADDLPRRLRDLRRRELGGGLTLLVAGSRRSRRRGLAKLDELAPHHGLLLERCRSVHTAGMRFAVDLLWLDAAGELVRLDAGVVPRRLRSCRRACAVVECTAGDGERFAAQLAAHARPGGRVAAPIAAAARSIEGGMDPYSEPFMEPRDTKQL